MDTGEGRMVRVESAEHEAALRKRYRNAKSMFEVGERVEVKGSWFKVKVVSAFGITLQVIKG